MKSQGKKEIEALHKEIKKRDNIIDELKEKNIILLRTSLKKGERIKELEYMLERIGKKNALKK